MWFHPSSHLAGASPLPLDAGYLLRVTSVPHSHRSSTYHLAGASLLCPWPWDISLYLLQRDIAQEAMVKTNTKKKKCKKAKWLSEDTLQIAEKIREVKGKGEKERYTHLNAEFQRRARKHKKAFLSNQCKEIEGNNRIGKTRALFRKIRDTKGTFQVKMGTIKDKDSMDLREAEDIKKRWQEYTRTIQKRYSWPR